MAKMDEFNGLEKLAIVEELQAGENTRGEIAHKYNINISTLVKWRHRYELYGIEGLEKRNRNRKYSPELKLQAVQDYLSGTYSQNEIIDKYKIASRTQLRKWIDKYNGRSSFKSINEGARALTKGRSTTWQERICEACERRFFGEHDRNVYWDQDTKKPHFLCHDCLIIHARHRRWMMKAHMQLKMKAMERKVASGTGR